MEHCRGVTVAAGFRTGINVFVCLQKEVDLNTPERLWRSGEPLRPYFHDLRNLLQDSQSGTAR
jgi:hypothetical protein